MACVVGIMGESRGWVLMSEPIHGEGETRGRERKVGGGKHGALVGLTPSDVTGSLPAFFVFTAQCADASSRTPRATRRQSPSTM